MVVAAEAILEAGLNSPEGAWWVVAVVAVMADRAKSVSSTLRSSSGSSKATSGLVRTVLPVALSK